MHADRLQFHTGFLESINTISLTSWQHNPERSSADPNSAACTLAQYEWPCNATFCALIQWAEADAFCALHGW